MRMHWSHLELGDDDAEAGEHTLLALHAEVRVPVDRPVRVCPAQESLNEHLSVWGSWSHALPVNREAATKPWRGGEGLKPQVRALTAFGEALSLSRPAHAHRNNR